MPFGGARRSRPVAGRDDGVSLSGMARTRAERPARRLRGWRVILLGWLVLATVAVWLGETYLRRAVETLEKEAGGRLMATASALEQSLLRTIEAVDGLQALAQTRHDLLLHGNPTGAASIADYLSLVALQERFGVLQVAVIGPDGMLTWSTVPGWQPVPLTDRVHFRVHADSPPNQPYGLFVSEPLVGRASGRWSIQLSRAIIGPGGSFDGVVVVSLDPILLSNRMAEVNDGPGEVSVLLRLPDGVLLARSRDAEGQLGRRTARKHAAVTAAQEAPRGRIRARSVVDDRELLMGYMTLRDAPLVIAVAQDWVEVVAPHRLLAQWVRVSLAGGLLVLLAGALLLRQLLATRRARARLAEAEAARLATVRAWSDLERLLAAAPAAICAAELAPADLPAVTGRPHFVSPNFVRITGWDPAVLLGEDAVAGGFAGLLDEEGLAARATMAAGLRATGEASCEYRLRRPDGTWRWIREEARVVGSTAAAATAPEAGPAPPEVVSYLSDITEQRRITAQAFGAAKLVTLGEMAANMAHELNQPLAVISLASENAAAALEDRSEAGHADALETLELIAQQAARCKDVVRHLRMFSRGEDMKTLSAIALDEVLDGALLLTGGALREAEVELVLALDAALPPVQGDQVAAEQVFVNLLLNARDAVLGLPAGTPRRIRVASRQEAEDVVVTVADNGGGIPPALMERLFEPFFTTKPVGQGTGLGLSICHGIMRAFGGGITAANGAEGAEMAVRFRIATPARPTTAQGALAG